VKQLLKRIKNRDAVIAVAGLGYVGLPLAIACANQGFRSIGLDTNKDKVAKVNAGQSYVNDVPSESLVDLVKSGQLKATADYNLLSEADIIIVCVPTPLNKTKDPDLSMVVRSLKKVAQNIRRSQLVVLESTTYPGFTREVALPLLEKSGLSCGRDFYLAFSPERTDPGNRKYGVTNTTKILGANTPDCRTVATALYNSIIDEVHVVSSTDAAEMVKLLENTFRAVNIGLVNEVAIMCHHLDIDTWEVIDAARTKPFGFMPFYPGPGLGGHCIPIDPLYLSWKLRSHNYTARFVELAQTINASMPDFVARMVMDALNDHEKAVKGSKVVLFGVAYKKNTDDIRESPALAIMSLLQGRGAILRYCDPFVPQVVVAGHTYRHMPAIEALQWADLVLITADHTAFDMPLIVQEAKLIVDTRNGTRRANPTPEQRQKIYLL
jgi:UDP-N-acetyl-D-glucosamine dehydrogenase